MDTNERRERGGRKRNGWKRNEGKAERMEEKGTLLFPHFQPCLTVLERALAKSRSVCLSVCPPVRHTGEPRYTRFKISKCVLHTTKQRCF